MDDSGASAQMTPSKRKHEEGENPAAAATATASVSEDEKVMESEPIGLLPLDFDSDDEDYIPEGQVKADRQVWMKYLKQVRESEGFDIEDFPGSSFMAHIVPLHQCKRSPRLYRILCDFSETAIKQYNDQHGKVYKFKDIVKANASPCGGLMYYITFMAVNPEAAVGDGVDPPPELFQAQAYLGIGEEEVDFCRPRPT